MEILLILIALIIFVYVFYQTLTKPKFNKAISLFDSGKFEDAIKLLNSIFEKHPDAPAKLAECKFRLGLQAKQKNDNDALVYFNEILEIGKRLTVIATKAKYELIEAKAYFEIASITFNKVLTFGNSDVKINNLKDNLHFIAAAIKTGIESDFAKLQKEHLSLIGESHFQLGLKNEKSLDFSEAIKNYSAAKNYSNEFAKSVIPSNSMARIAICKLKMKPNNIEFVSFADFHKADAKYVHDFFYRYVLFLLKKESYTDADIILTEHLNHPSPTIATLKQVIKNKRITMAIKKANEINLQIEELYQNSFPVEDVKALYESISLLIKETEQVIPDLSYKLSELRPSLLNRLLSHHISSEQYGNAINLIQKYPLFWEIPELHKNLGICCYGFMAKGYLTEKNYRIVISSWLTSVFSDKIILKSLEATAWDESYTFTLTESIGSEYSQHSELPDNVNYDEVSDTNISIGTIQKELLQQFESLLQKTISDSSLSKLVNDFYTSEKESIGKIVSVIDKDILFPAPHFARSYGINELIIKLLDNDFLEYSDEKSLEVGIPYLKDYTETFVREYATAKELISSMIKAINNEKLHELKAVTSDRKKDLIEKYITIKKSIEDLVLNAFALKIEEDNDNEDLIPLMEECINFVRQNDKLKAQCSNFIYSYCNSNWDTQSSVRLLELMIKSIKVNPNNYRAAKSIAVLINNNLIDIVNENTSSDSKIYSLIDEVKEIRSEVLKEALKELLVLRKKLLSSIGKEAETSIFLGFNLSPNGLKMKKVINTMQILGGGSLSGNVLDLR